VTSPGPEAAPKDAYVVKQRSPSNSRAADPDMTERAYQFRRQLLLYFPLKTVKCLQKYHQIFRFNASVKLFLRSNYLSQVVYVIDDFLFGFGCFWVTEISSVQKFDPG